jgi:hypothetical protein
MFTVCGSISPVRKFGEVKISFFIHFPFISDYGP